MSAAKSLPARFLALLRRRDSLVADRSAIRGEIEAIDDQLRQAMGESEQSDCGPYRVFWRTSEVARLDQKLLREQHPRVWKACRVVETQRRLRITRQEEA